MTSVIHGKYAHEETMATKSMCETYVCVKNIKEAEMLADYMLNGKEVKNPRRANESEIFTFVSSLRP